MIRIFDASRLAFTKLRTRRIRLGITVFVSALIFSALMAASLISNGVFHSIESYNAEGFGRRYVLSANASSFEASNIFMEPSVIDRAAALEKDQIQKKKQEAKRLGIEYNPQSEPPAVEEFEGPNGKQRSVSFVNPLGQQAMSEYFLSHPQPGKDELAKLADKYQAIGYYQSIGLSFSGPNAPNLAILKEGKEDFAKANQQGGNPFQKGTDGFTTSWQLMSADLLKPFLLPGQSPDIDSTGTLPVVAPYTAAEQLLGLKALPASAKPAAKLERLKEVRAKASNLKFSVCYRNQTSAEQISQTISTQQEIDRGKNIKDYQKPKLIYKLPDTACGPIVVASDKRTADEKKLADKEESFRRTFGEKPPETTILNFRVIGISPDPPEFNAPTVNGILASLLSSNLGQAGWFTPIEARGSQPLLASLFPEKPTDNTQIVINYVELSDAASARTFLEQENCQPDFSAFNGPGPPSGTNLPNPYAKCKADGKLFEFRPFGSSSLALDEAKKGFSKIFRIAALVITAVAAIIMIGTVGRVIADSRRETAVFRAIGAKRLDIAQIYFTYTIFLAGLVAVAALLIGFVLASIADAKWSDSLTIDALVAYNAQDLSRQFSLFGFNGPQLLTILGLIILAGLISAILPLLTNIRRNPIKDMRDEN